MIFDVLMKAHAYYIRKKYIYSENNVAFEYYMFFIFMTVWRAMAVFISKAPSLHYTP